MNINYPNKKIRFDFYDSSDYNNKRQFFATEECFDNSILENQSPVGSITATEFGTMRSIDSSTSINSLFDNNYSSSFCKRSLAVTPIISRNELDIKEDLALVNKKLTKACIILVGLPASGKSTFSKKISEYLNKNNIKAAIYNAGDIRRQIKRSFNDAEFFNPNNSQAKQERETFATMTVTNLINDLSSHKINVGFLDATNTTIERRSRMINLVKASNITNVIIIDVQCSDERLLMFNISAKAHNLDYKGKDYITSIQDFKERTKHYFRIYEPITPEELQKNNDVVSLYIKVIDGGKEISFTNTCSETLFEDQEIFKILKKFSSNYVESESKRYYEAVDAFYSKLN